MYTEDLGALDLDAYLARIGHRGDVSPCTETLAALQRAHVSSIPFENLDVLLGRPILLDLPSLQEKLIRKRRGGYCFEQNTLFAAVLEKVGFEVTALAARVRLGAVKLLPRTHMLLKVRIGADAWLADVGFGADGMLGPLPWITSQELSVGDRGYRLLPDGSGLVLQLLRDGSWQDMYVFNEEPQHPVDFEVANHYTSTFPTSRFMQILIAQRATPEVRSTLRNREFTQLDGEKTHSRLVESDEELLDILRKTFGLEFPAGIRFKCPGLVE
jgi:N-hydroxyarylamine O-acetyltransferase